MFDQKLLRDFVSFDESCTDVEDSIKYEAELAWGSGLVARAGSLSAAVTFISLAQHSPPATAAH